MAAMSDKRKTSADLGEKQMSAEMTTSTNKSDVKYRAQLEDNNKIAEVGGAESGRRTRQLMAKLTAQSVADKLTKEEANGQLNKLSSEKTAAEEKSQSTGAVIRSRTPKIRIKSRKAVSRPPKLVPEVKTLLPRKTKMDLSKCGAKKMPRLQPQMPHASAPAHRAPCCTCHFTASPAAAASNGTTGTTPQISGIFPIPMMSPAPGAMHPGIWPTLLAATANPNVPIPIPSQIGAFMGFPAVFQGHLFLPQITAIPLASLNSTSLPPQFGSSGIFGSTSPPAPNFFNTDLLLKAAKQQAASVGQNKGQVSPAAVTTDHNANIAKKPDATAAAIPAETHTLHIGQEEKQGGISATVTPSLPASDETGDINNDDKAVVAVKEEIEGSERSYQKDDHVISDKPKSKEEGKRSKPKSGDERETTRKKRKVVKVESGSRKRVRGGRKKRAVESNWEPVGEGVKKMVYLTNDHKPLKRVCYDEIKHKTEPETIRVKDCVSVLSGEDGVSHIAKIARIFTDLHSEQLMANMIWYYKPEQTVFANEARFHEQELFASRHLDSIPVDCIVELVYVLTFNEYCRFIAENKSEISIPSYGKELVSRGSDEYPRRIRQPAEDSHDDVVYFVRRVYDFAGKKFVKNRRTTTGT